LNRKVILSHSGKQHAYHVAKALSDLGYLEKFYTSSYVTSQHLQKLIAVTGNKYWSRRFLAGLNGHRVEANWRFEMPEIIYNKLFGQTARTVSAIYQRDVKFDGYMASRMRSLKGDIFWGFQGSCFESLKAANENDKITICELATAHAPAAKKILEEEKLLNPEWADSIDNVSFPDTYYERLCEEPHRADVVIGASQFTLQTLLEEGVPASKLRFLPLGFEVDHIPFELNKKRKEGPIRLLYAGRITQRKGIKYLLEAMKQFRPEEVELHIIGYVHGSGKALKNYSNFILHPPLQQYELFKKYQEFDAFVLPSVFEGFGLVIVEAMAAGLPVITTPHSIGPELITHGENGYIVPIRQTDAIVRSVSEYIQKNDQQMSEMRRKAHESALQYSWNSYQNRLMKFLSSIVL
jgi:glycosyltransferase involved in cell wall biosynthesis